MSGNTSDVPDVDTNHAWRAVVLPTSPVDDTVRTAMLCEPCDSGPTRSVVSQPLHTPPSSEY
jgi:hypothetical protein